MTSLSQRFSLAQRSYRLATVLGGCLSFGIVLLASLQPFVPVASITRDPAAIAGHPAYYGALSNLGILLWSASATVCFLGAIVIVVLQPRSESVAFFSAFGGLSTVLCMDDLFMLHEESGAEELFFAIYAIALSVMLFRFRKILLRPQSTVFILSLLLFAVSVGADLLLPLIDLPMGHYALEDGVKFLAISAWFSYFWREAADRIISAACLATLPIVERDPWPVQSRVVSQRRIE